MGIEAAATLSSRDMLGFPGSSDIAGSDYGGTPLFVRPAEKRGRSETIGSVGVGNTRRKDGQGDDLIVG